jgi:hypothetical protein
MQVNRKSSTYGGGRKKQEKDGRLTTSHVSDKSDISKSYTTLTNSLQIGEVRDCLTEWEEIIAGDDQSLPPT